MVIANAWHYNPEWAGPARLDEVVDETIKAIQQQASTGRFAYYFVPAQERPKQDAASHDSGADRSVAALQRLGLATTPVLQGESLDENTRQERQSLASLDLEELDRRLSDQGPNGDEVLYWEKHRRYREAVIARLKELYDHEYHANPAFPGDPNFDHKGNTPCHLFDLGQPKH